MLRAEYIRCLTARHASYFERRLDVLLRAGPDVCAAARAAAEAAAAAADAAHDGADDDDGPEAADGLAAAAADAAAEAARARRLAHALHDDVLATVREPAIVVAADGVVSQTLTPHSPCDQTDVTSP